jgi:Sigma-70, region 4
MELEASGRHGRRLLAVATALLVGAGGAADARAADGSTATSALGIELPPVEVKLPAVEVKLPAVQVKVPSVEVDLSPVEVKVPSVEAQLPAAGVKLPPVDVKLPPTEVAVPQVDAPAPRASDPPARAPTGSAVAPAARRATGEDVTAHETAHAGAPAPAANGGTARRGPAGGRDLPSPTRSTRADPRGDGEVPPAIRRRERRLRDVVRSLGGCLGALPALETRVLTLRAGGPGRPPLSRRQVARRLDVGRQRVAAVERRGLDRLRAQARAGGCAAQPAHAVATTPTDPEAGTAPPASTTPAASPPPHTEPRDRTGVVEAVTRSLGGGIAPHLAPSILLIRANSPPLLVLVFGGFLVGFTVVWLRERRNRPVDRRRRGAVRATS